MFGSITFLIAAVFLAAVILWKLRTNSRSDVSERPIPVFDPNRYRVLERLLRDTDIAYVREHPGIPAATLRKFAEGRSRIARSYLTRLKCDFDLLYRDAVLITATSDHDCSTMAAELFRCKVRFEWTVFLVRLRLYVMPLWIGRADYRRVTGTLETAVRLMHACRQMSVGTA